MRKLLFAIGLILGMSGFVSAQTKTTATVKTKAAVTSSTAPKKADGTLDMRYKKNKGTVSSPGPKKADGTLDMRFKKNQPAAKAKVKAKAN